ncbi:MAG: hypothetical protein GY811_02350 [Myxococcales bacterium]|jgi:hypothetical protein|nr:hypothetical protein [Myxococcales bacterium]
MEGILRGRLEEARAAFVARGSATEHLPACIQAATSQRWSQLQSAQFAALGGGVGWAQSELGDFLQALSSGSLQGRKLQNYEGFIEFLTPQLWEFVLSPHSGFTAKMAAFSEHLGALGLRHPSCPTAANMAAFLLLVCKQTGVETGEITRELLQSYLATVKSSFKNLVATMPPPRDGIQALPITPGRLQSQYPITYVDAFPPGVGATAPQINPVEMVTIAKLINLRAGKKSGHLALPAPAPARGGLQPSHGPGGGSPQQHLPIAAADSFSGRWPTAPRGITERIPPRDTWYWVEGWVPGSARGTFLDAWMEGVL